MFHSYWWHIRPHLLWVWICLLYWQDLLSKNDKFTIEHKALGLSLLLLIFIMNFLLKTYLSAVHSASIIYFEIIASALECPFLAENPWNLNFWSWIILMLNYWKVFLFYLRLLAWWNVRGWSVEGAWRWWRWSESKSS